MDEMLGRLSSFSITEDEAAVIGIPDDVIEKSRKGASFGLMGRVLSSKPFNKGLVMSTMVKLWATDGDISAQVIDRDIFLFSFEKEQDRARVLAMEPWSFNKSLILLKAVNGDETPRWDSWYFTCFWIRVFNLPYDGMTREIGEKIGNGIGRFLDVVTDKKGRCPGVFMRLRVQIDVSRPLRRGALVQLGSNGAKMWTSFKYERLPDFCFGCGRIGHGRLECVDDKMRGANASEQLPYSPELRADPRSDRSLGLGNAGGGRWKGSSGRGEPSPGLGNTGEERRGARSFRSHGQGGPSFPGSGTQIAPATIRPVSPAPITQELPLVVSPDLGEPDPSLTVIPQRDLKEEIAVHGDNGTVDFVLPGTALVEGGHVRGTDHLIDTGSFERPASEGGNHVHVSPPTSKVDLPYVEGMHGFINVEGSFERLASEGGNHVHVSPPTPKVDLPYVEGMHGISNEEGMHGKKAADGLVFSAGATESVKRSAGKWKKAARLKGANGEGPAPAPESVNTKRKMELELAAGEASKSRKIEVHSMEAAVLAEAVVQPRQGQ
ncbi:hypothetical protein TIFTF001_027393 [Ficus carica]|uniref:CCHC-type domain-containing protein n=1 Tax=Ficus carica TaxID=3494 RepID=A0AA88DMW1_FICCA|nr:hypothetical protein TIFTF001_027393 [Ficus carica]